MGVSAALTPDGDAALACGGGGAGVDALLCGCGGCGPARIKVRIAGTLRVSYSTTTSSALGGSGTRRVELTFVIPGAELTLDRVNDGVQVLYSAEPSCRLVAHGFGTFAYDTTYASGFRNQVTGTWGGPGDVGEGFPGVRILAAVVGGVCSLRSLTFAANGTFVAHELRTDPFGNVLVDFTDGGLEPLYVDIPFVPAPFVGDHAAQDYRRDYFGVDAGAYVGGFTMLPEIMPALLGPATRTTGDGGPGNPVVTTTYQSNVSVPTLRVENHTGMASVCNADHVVEAALCADPENPDEARIRVDLLDALEGVPSLPIVNSDVYVPTDVPTGPPLDTQTWEERACEPDPLRPVYALCIDPSQTRLVDDTGKPADARTAVFGSLQWFDTGDRERGDGDTPEAWSTSLCPGVEDTPQFELCGALPGVFGGRDEYRRLYWSGATAGTQYVRTTVRLVLPLTGCVEYWTFTYRRAENLSGPFVTPLGLDSSVQSCAPPEREARRCDGVLVDPDRGPVNPLNPAGRTGPSARGGLPPGYDPTAAQVDHHTCKGCSG